MRKFLAVLVAGVGDLQFNQRRRWLDW